MITSFAGSGKIAWYIYGVARTGEVYYVFHPIYFVALLPYLPIYYVPDYVTCWAHGIVLHILNIHNYMLRINTILNLDSCLLLFATLLLVLNATN